VLCFTFEATSHWHNSSYDEQQCQLCHFAHSLSFELSHRGGLPVPATTVAEASVTWINPYLELVFHRFSSRAPPAFAISGASFF